MEEKKSSHCSTYLDVINKLKSTFGDKFDDLQFFSASGAAITGAELKRAESGCDILDVYGLGWLCNCRGFDEQLKLVNSHGAALAGVQFRLGLADGKEIHGRTDSEGCTQRVRSREAVAIKELFLYSGIAGCGCGTRPASGESQLAIPLGGLITNKVNVGSSQETVVVDQDARILTEGEIRIARLIFKDSIDYSKVRIYKRGFLWFNLQPKNVIMAPNGNIYYNEIMHRDDFSKSDAKSTHTFIHEMTHVWQYTLGYPVFSSRLVRPRITYSYKLMPGMSFGDYNMEAQGQILADYFAVKYLRIKDVMEHEENFTKISDFEEVLAGFIGSPSDAENLPRRPDDMHG
jgi:hypothetical protein